MQSLASLTRDLTPGEKYRLDEVANLMLEIYQTLTRMRYLDPSWIQPGRHDLNLSLFALYSSLKLDPKIIYLYSVLPYIDPPVAGNLDFFQGSGFADFRNKDHVIQARNPMYAVEESEKMRPWMTPLCMLGNHQSIVIYDAKRHVVGIYDHESMWSFDRNLDEGKIFMTTTTHEEGGAWMETTRYFRILENKTEEECGVEEWERQQIRGGGDDEDQGQNGQGDQEGPLDKNQWDEMQARQAPNVLRDIARWYRELIEVPGGGEHSGGRWEEEITRPLYLKHGWPSDDFDGDAFLIDQARAHAMDTVKYVFAESAKKVRNLGYDIEKHAQEEPEFREEHQKRLAEAVAANNVDEE